MVLLPVLTLSLTCSMLGISQCCTGSAGVVNTSWVLTVGCQGCLSRDVTERCKKSGWGAVQQDWLKLFAAVALNTVQGVVRVVGRCPVVVVPRYPCVVTTNWVG